MIESQSKDTSIEHGLAWLRRYGYFALVGLFFTIAFVKLSVIGMINRHPISVIEAFIGVGARWSCWLLFYFVINKAVMSIPLSPRNLATKYLPLVVTLSFGAVFWGICTDLVFISGSPSVSGYAFNAIVYDLPSTLALTCLLTAAMYWSRLPDKSSEIAKEAVQLPMTITVKKGNKTVVVKIDEITAISAQDYYSEVITDSEAYLVRKSLSKFAEELQHQGFVKVSRSALVNQAFIVCLDKTSATEHFVELSTGQRFKVSRGNVASLKALLG